MFNAVDKLLSLNKLLSIKNFNKTKFKAFKNEQTYTLSRSISLTSTANKKKITDTLSTIQNEILEPHLKFKRIEIDANAQEKIDNFKCEILLNHVDTIPSIPIRRVIYIKDKHNISDVTYKNLRSKLKLQLPSLVKLKSERRLYDQKINIKQNSKGVYLNIEQNCNC